MDHHHTLVGDTRSKTIYTENYSDIMLTSKQTFRQKLLKCGTREEICVGVIICSSIDDFPVLLYFFTEFVAREHMAYVITNVNHFDYRTGPSGSTAVGTSKLIYINNRIKKITTFTRADFMGTDERIRYFLFDQRKTLFENKQLFFTRMSYKKKVSGKTLAKCTILTYVFCFG